MREAIFLTKKKKEKKKKKSCSNFFPSLIQISVGRENDSLSDFTHLIINVLF